MKAGNSSIFAKVLFPIFILVTGISLALFLIILETSHKVSVKHFSFVMSHHAAEANRILDTAVTELVAARLLDNPVVAEAKQRVAIDEIAGYWKTNDLQGIILDAGGKSLYSSVTPRMEEAITPFIAGKGAFHAEKGLHHINGYASVFPAWNWTVVTILRPVKWIREIFGKELMPLLLIVFLGMTVLFTSVAVILKRNFRNPVGNIIDDIGAAREIRKTGIKELDTIVSAINEAFLRLQSKTAHVSALHDIALSLQDHSRDETIHAILAKISPLLNAGVSVLALYDDHDALKDVITFNADPGSGFDVRKEKVVLDYMHRTADPERINDVGHHPAFRDSIPAERPPLQNMVIMPILSEEKKPVATLLFANKPGGFTVEDEHLLRAVAADTAVALSKAENIMQLGRFKKVIDSSFDVVALAGGSGEIEYINPACETVTGYTQHELAGKKLDILFGLHHGVAANIVWNTLSAGKVWRGEFMSRKKLGDTCHTSAVLFPLQFADETWYALILRDITQEKRLHEHLLRSQKLEAVGTLASGIAHDFNNLLAAIMGYSEIMQSQLREGDPFFKPVDIIHKASLQGAELTKKILTITRREVPEMKPVDMNEAVRTALDLLQRSIPKSIEMRTELAAHLPPVEADPSQLQQVIFNLAINARDAIVDTGKLTLATEYVAAEGMPETDRPLDADGFVKLSISDTGAGMDPDTLRKIFDPFFTTKEKGKGTGLGLYIVHSIVTSYGGHINVYSEPGLGTRFTLYFPVSSAQTTVPQEVTEDLRGSGTILVIDDETNVQEVCKDILQPLGYRVLVAGGGSEGIQIFKEMQDRIAAVVLDMIMPRMGGSEVFEILKTIRPDVRVIFCSGYSREGLTVIQELVKQGAASFVEKPFSRLALGRAVKRATGTVSKS